MQGLYLPGSVTSGLVVVEAHGGRYRSCIPISLPRRHILLPVTQLLPTCQVSRAIASSLLPSQDLYRYGVRRIPGVIIHYCRKMVCKRRSESLRRLHSGVRARKVILMIKVRGYKTRVRCSGPYRPCFCLCNRLSQECACLFAMNRAVVDDHEPAVSYMLFGGT